MKEKTGKGKKVLRIILGIILILIVFNIGSTCIARISAKKIPHHFASAEEGRELLLANTKYFDNMSQNDLDFRLQKSGATMEEFQDKSAQGIQDFNFFEKCYLERRIAKMSRKLKKNGYTLPPLKEITFIKTDMSLEANASGYTHGTEIYLNAGTISAYTYLHLIPEFTQAADGLLWHELFHCLTRNNPDFRAQMYSLIHFTVADSDFELPPSVKEYFLSNPDVGHHDSYATFLIDGQETECFIAWVSPQHYAEAQTDFMSCSITALVPTDGRDTYYTMEQASNFDEIFGTNTGYVIDPEECMADNFSYAMVYGIDGRDKQGYPNPEIIQGIIDAVSN